MVWFCGDGVVHLCDILNVKMNTALLTDSLNISVLNVVGIEKRIEKCAVEATQCSSTFCKVSQYL